VTSISDPETLFEEVAFVAYHFGWSHDAVLALPHWERRRWCEEISAINERMNEPVTPDTDTEEAPQQGSFFDTDDGGVVIQNTLD